MIDLKGGLKAVLLETRDVALQIRHFTFEVQDVDQFQFEPGQFVSMYYPIEGKLITRAYSIAGPVNANRFEICLNRVEDGKFSPVLFSLKPGDSVDFKGPYGTFVWRNQDRDSILVATGTGITPYRGMLADRLAEDRERNYWLVFGVRHPEGIIYREEWDALAANHSNFQFWPTLSRAGDDWPGRRGYVQEHVMNLLGDRRDVDIYICGMKAMVDDLRERLKVAGLDRRHIIYEKYD